MLENIVFDYIKTFSGLRGATFEYFQQTTLDQIRQLEQNLPMARYMEKVKIRKEIEILKEKIDPYNSRLVNIAGEYHETTTEVTTLKKDHDIVKEIQKVFGLKMQNDIAAACPPIYRDTIVFYSEANEIKALFHICFGCYAMKNAREEPIEIAENVYLELKKILKRIGHHIE